MKTGIRCGARVMLNGGDDKYALYFMEGIFKSNLYIPFTIVYFYI